MRFQEEPGRAVFAFAEPGEHTESVLQSLGYGQEELDALRREGVI